MRTRSECGSGSRRRRVQCSVSSLVSVQQSAAPVVQRLCVCVHATRPTEATFSFSCWVSLALAYSRSCEGRYPRRASSASHCIGHNEKAMGPYQPIRAARHPRFAYALSFFWPEVFLLLFCCTILVPVFRANFIAPGAYIHAEAPCKGGLKIETRARFLPPCYMLFSEGSFGRWDEG